MSDVKKIIENIDIDLWSEILGPYTDDLYGEWLILDISQDDLINEDESNIKEIGRITYKDWDALRKTISDKDVDEEKEENEAYLKELRDGCDCGDEICECDYTITRTILYCKNKYVHSASSYQRD